MRVARNILYLGIKELRSLMRDPILLLLIAFALTLNIYSAAKAMPETLNKAPIAIVDEDQSALSARIRDAFYPPSFLPPVLISPAEMDARMDAGLDTFALMIPPDFERDVLAGRRPEVQLNIDATRMSQAFTGANYVQAIVSAEVNGFVQRHSAKAGPKIGLAVRTAFNPELNRIWYGAVMEIVSAITMLAVVLTGAALIREREHGTVEHLLAMPVTPFEIMASKVWAMALVVLVVSALSLSLLVRGVLAVPIQGSLALFFAGTALHLFATTALGIFLATIARSMPQFALLLFMTLLPMQILSGAGGILRAQAFSSGGLKQHEGMAGIIDVIMQAAPTTHFVEISQAILFRGAGLDVVWPQFLSLAGIGAILFVLSLARFRKTLAMMA
ncbi:ABC transporter permease [Thiohalocapsa marina]|uniref:ABC transporter permease n=1 Tax=Thiohalocapsa marina TaxID=424902 RepID=A0A5M8FI85_9GAMM|nr:ABC transporter permease [Thiohalocapsa marina]KAA6183476.1 ABC transporter permease [Thiohalocapsa marina]